MAIPTVFMVGTERLPLVQEYLNLGSVVVVAPDQQTLKRWVHEMETQDDARPTNDLAQYDGTVVDLAGRRILTHDGQLPLSDLEFKVLAALLTPPGRAVAFRELRRIGWGQAAEIPDDVYAVRALVQRVRAKLAVADSGVKIEAVRGYGFRAIAGRACDGTPATVSILQTAGRRR